MLPKLFSQNLIRDLPNGYAFHKMIFDDEGNPIDYLFMEVNKPYEEVTGFSRSEIIGKGIREVQPEVGNGKVDYIKAYGQVAKTGNPIKLVYYSSNLERWYNITAYSNRKGYFSTIFHDITNEKETEFRLRDKERELKKTQRIARVGRWDYYHFEDRLDWGEFLYHIFEQSPDNFQPSYENFLQLVHMDDRENIRRTWARSLLTQEPSTTEYRIIRKDGSIRWIKNKCISDFDKDGQAIHTIGIVQDITDIKEIEAESKEKQKEIEFLSFFDQLTKLYNRRFFETEIKRLDTRRNLPISIIFADVNGLKTFNDLHGHAVGDELLVKVADVLREACRADDIIARTGGDEFAILLPTTTGYDAERIIQRIQSLSSLEKIRGLDISIALGYGIKQNEMDKIQDIMKNAEDHMYDNKFLQGKGIEKEAMKGIVNIIEEKYPQEKEYFKNAIRMYEKMSKRIY